VTAKTDRLAVVLRGPLAAGKSEIAEELRRRLAIHEPVAVLDGGWDGKRLKGRETSRYPELVSDARVLIIELGYGEPFDPAELGATRNPMEWVSVLEAGGRRTVFFLLTVPVDIALMRNRVRPEQKRLRDDVVVEAHARYAADGPCSSQRFLARLGNDTSETVIHTDKLQIDGAATHVIDTLRALGFYLARG
jgi:hypothetical protein